MCKEVHTFQEHPAIEFVIFGRVRRMHIRHKGQPINNSHHIVLCQENEQDTAECITFLARVLCEKSAK